MYDAHECQICNTVKTGAEALCKPEPKHNICAPPVDSQVSRHAQCEPIKSHTDYYCGGCGRPSLEPELLCIPQRY